ncbi:MAG: 3-deoxy-D-manno-octulosonic-acid transferase [Abditibacteriota bacterium]|nr:3-deoxy-D-manno-octulosonic-acid transferase [Abditibacteriota bacterium]
MPSRRARARNRCVGRVIGWLARGLGSTLRQTWHGNERLIGAQKRGQSGGRGAIVASWHGNLVLPSLARRDRGWSVIVSRSNDGEIAASALETLGWKPMRGSHFWGSLEVVKSALKALRAGHIVAITPDGPRGPVRVAAPGAEYFGSRGYDVFPVGVAAHGARLKTWDRLLVPRPFGRAIFVVGEAVGQSTLSLQDAIDACDDEAQRMLELGNRMDRNRRVFAVYNLLLWPLLPGVWLYTQWRRFGQGKSSASVRGLWGHVPREASRALKAENGAEHSPVVWVHAVSVGETMAARAVARALKKQMPHAKIALSVTTDTGMDTALAAQRAGEVEAVFYYPIDAPLAIRRALNAIQPDAFLAIETELWPNFLSMAQSRGVRTFLVNGRVSDKLQRSAPRIAPLWRWMMANFDALLMRSSYDAERMNALNAGLHVADAYVLAIGDVKLDLPEPSEVGIAVRAQWRQTLGIEEDALLWVCGSTHPGEEASVLRAYHELRTAFPTLRLLLAPRHIERTEEVQNVISDSGLSFVRRSQPQSTLQAARDAVILLDTVGELGQIYAAADVAFVGGSLIGRGGHNMIEPVLRGVPVTFGPHIANFREAAALVQSADVGRMVQNEAELTEATRHWLLDEAGRNAIGQRVEDAFVAHRGASHRVAAVVAQTLSGAMKGDGRAGQSTFEVPAP